MDSVFYTHPETEIQAERRRQKTATKKAKQDKPRRPNQWDRRKLGCKIYKYFHAGRTDIHFADDDHGRSWALAFVLCHFSNKALIADFSWLADKNRLRALRREARKLTFDDIGLLIHLTDKARDDCKAWRFFPWHVAPSGRDSLVFRAHASTTNGMASTLAINILELGLKPELQNQPPRYADLFSRYRHNEKWDCHGDEAPRAKLGDAAE